MTEYHNHGVTLCKRQIQKIHNACKKSSSATIRLTKARLTGNFYINKLPLTQTQFNKIKKAKNGVQLTLSEAQLKTQRENGRFYSIINTISNNS